MARSPTLDVLAVCVVVFALQLLVAAAEGWRTVITLFALATPLEVRPWTIVTSVYAHGGIGHLVGNAVTFALVGLLLERSTTRGRFHAFVLATGAAAGIAQVTLAGALGVGASVLGLSGAVFALLGYVLTGNRLASGAFAALDLPAPVQLAIFAVLAVVVTLLTASPRAALVGHFVGLLLGLIAGRLNLLDAESAEGRNAVET